MRTIEEVREFVKHFGFSKQDASKIMGFLLGKGVIEKGGVVEFVQYPVTAGLQILGFNDFYDWFESEDELKTLEGLLNFLQDEQDKALEAGDAKKADELAMYLGFLVDALELEYEEVSEDEDSDRK